MLKTLTVMAMAASVVFLVGCGQQGTKARTTSNSEFWSYKQGCPAPACAQTPTYREMNASCGCGSSVAPTTMPAQKSMFGVSGGTWGMLAAAHDLNDGKLAESRFNAAKTLGDMGPQANNWLALWRLKQGCEDICPAVRVASADACERSAAPRR